MLKKPKGYISPMERVKDPEVRRRVDEKKREIELSTVILESMDQVQISVRDLARKARVAPSTIQSLRSGNADNIGLGKLIRILGELGKTICIRPLSQDDEGMGPGSAYPILKTHGR